MANRDPGTDDGTKSQGPDRLPRRHPAREDNTRLLRGLAQDEAEFLAAHKRLAPLLQVPQSLAGIRHIVGNLREIGRIAAAHQLFDDDVAADLARWLDVFERSDRNHGLWKLGAAASKRAARGGTEGSRQPDFHGIHETHPVWCAIFFASGTREDEAGVDWQALHAAYRYLQTLFIAAFMVLYRAGSADAKSHRLREASLLLRGLHQRVYVPSLLRFTGIDDVTSAFDLLRDQHKYGPKHLRQGFGALAELLDDAWNLSSEPVFGARGSKGRANSHGGRRRHPYDLIPSDHRQFSALIDVDAWLEGEDAPRASVEVLEGSTDFNDALYRSGISPLEYEVEGSLRVSIAELDLGGLAPNELPPLQTLYGAANAAARARVMEAQRFTTRLNRIAVADLAMVMASLDAIYAALEEGRAPPSASIRANEAALLQETVLLLSAALVTGSSIDDLCGLRDGSDPSRLPHEWSIAFASKSSAWIRPYRGPSRSPLRYHQAVEPIATQPRVLLMDVWSVGSAIATSVPAPWFQHKASTYRKVFQRTIRPELEKAGVPKRWCRFDSFSEILPSHFSGLEEGDQLRIAVLFGREDRLAHVHHFYTVLNRSDLALLYATQLTTLWSTCLANGFHPGSGLFSLRSFPAEAMSWVGNDRSPTIQMLDELVTAVRARMKTLDEDPAASPVDRHNARATYTALTLAIITGCRAVRTPFPDLTLVDPTFGFVSLHEKDTIDGSHARIVWLPPRVRRLIEQYLQSVDTLWWRLPPNQPNAITVPATKTRDRLRFDGSTYKLSLKSTIWFIKRADKGLEAVEWTGHSLRQQLEEILPGRWPIENAGRHFLRSFLTRWNCASTVINAQLGHWSYGESPWMAESAFDPQQFRREIEPHLEKLLTRLGYEQ